MVSCEVSKILDLFHSRDWSEYYDYQDVPYFKKNIWFKINKVEEFNFVRELINKELEYINPTYKISDWITLLIYNKGDFFSLHKDSDSYLPENKRTVLSGGYILNKDFEGGDFLIDGKKLECKVGELFYFGRNVLHEVTKIHSGTRYSLHFAIDTNINKTII